MQYMQKFPRKYSTVGTNSKRFFNKYGNMKKIPEIKYKAFKEVLLEK